MNREQPTMDQLKLIGRELLNEACKELRKTGNIVPKLIFGDAMDETPNVIVIIDPTLVSSTAAKLALTSRIKREIATHGYTYIVLMLDMFRLGIRSEEEKQALKVLHGVLGISLDELAGMGLGQLCETIQVQIQSMTDSVSLSVEYSRNEDKSIKEVKDATEMPGFSHGLFKFF